MTRRNMTAALILFALLTPNFCAAQATQTPQPSPQPGPTPDAVERIKDEGVNRSRLMETIEHITDVIGPRLTGSPALRRANEWTHERLTQYGLANAHLEPWQFGRGWTLKRFSAEVIAPQAFPLLAYPRAWSPGLDSPLTADVVLVEAKNDAELQKYKGTLRGKIVLAGNVRELKPRFEPTAKRLSEKELLELADAPDPALLPRRPQRPQRSPEEIEAAKFNDRKTQFYYDEGVALLVGSSFAGDGGMLQFVQQAAVPQAFDTPFDKRVGPWEKSAPRLIPQMTISNDHYNRLARMIQQGERVQMSVNLQVEFDDSDPMSYNTVAEIPGTDLKDEVVMLGGHLDSWHTATGATDNAAGVGVMMEAVRILKAAGLQPRRTVRIALWSGEEEGLLGSRAYVKEHFGPVDSPATASNGTAEGASAKATPRYKPEYERLNVYFNVDSGTGAIRGIFLQGNEALRPIFSRWLMPFREFKVGQTTYSASTVTLSNTGGSDFLSFDAVGLNGFDFIQDEMEYETRTWHSNQDNYDHLVADDLKEAACIVAAFVYNAATMDGRLPRKERQQQNRER
ncbi:MAG: M20/M25/M40 family metallo-hydrolase [Pyrinomonadaceae bacterium]